MILRVEYDDNVRHNQVGVRVLLVHVGDWRDAQVYKSNNKHFSVGTFHGDEEHRYRDALTEYMVNILIHGGHSHQ